MTVPDPYLTPGDDRGTEPWRAPHGHSTSGITPTPATPAPEYTGPADHTRPTPSLPPYTPGGGVPYGQQPLGYPPAGGPSAYGGAGPYGGPNPYGATAGAPTATAYGSPYPGSPYPGFPTPYGAAPGAGYPGGPGYAYGTPGARRSNGIAVAALVTGLTSLFVLVLVTVGVGGIIGGIVGVVLGIVGLRRARAGLPGRGLATAGIVTSALAIAAGGLFITAVSGEIGDAWDDGWEQAERDAERDAVGTDDTLDRPDDASYEAGWSDGWDEGYAAASGATPVDAPATDDPELEQHLLGEPGTVGRFEIVVTSIDLEADQAVTDAFGDNPPALGGYVLVTISATNTGDVPARPYADLSTSYWGSDDLLYNEWTCQAWPARPAVEVGVLQPGESAEYEVCVDVPHAALGDAAGAAVLIEDLRGPAYTAVRWSAS